MTIHAVIFDIGGVLVRIEDVAPSGAVFADDGLPDVEGARLIGVHAVHFTDSLQVRKEIERLIEA